MYRERPVVFSSAGSGKFRKGQSQVTISEACTPANAKILVTMSQNPGKDNALKYARHAFDASVTVFLAKPAPGAPGVATFSSFMVL